MNYNLNTSYQTTVDTARQNKVLRNTYMLLALSLIPTIAGALMGINMNFGFMRASPIMSSLLMIGDAFAVRASAAAPEVLVSEPHILAA